MHQPRLRVLTYNVHRCIGSDGRLAPDRVAAVIAACQPDVVALQELDVGHSRTSFADQPRMLASYLEMDWVFHPAIRRADEHYGDAILSRRAMHLVQAASLPTLPGWPMLEQRGALWVTIEFHGRKVHVINTHLGLLARERLMQTEALLGSDWLGHPDCAGPRLLCGDLNAWPGTRAYRCVRRVLRDAQERPRHALPRCTYPARCPLLRIDHVFHSPDLVVHAVHVPRNRQTRVTSDHLPLLVE